MELEVKNTCHMNRKHELIYLIGTCEGIMGLASSSSQ